MTDEELIAAGLEIDQEATAKLRALGPPYDGKVWVNRTYFRELGERAAAQRARPTA